MEAIGISAAILSTASWAFATVLFDRLGKVIPYAGITFLKGTFSIVIMTLLIIPMGGLTALTLKAATILVISGIIGIGIGDSLFFHSLQDLGAKTQVLYFMLGQVVTMFLSFILLGDILSIRQYAGAVILLSGILIVIIGKQEDHPNKNRGIILGLLSILCYSFSSIMVKITIGDVQVLTATYYRMVAGTLSVLFIGVTTHNITPWIKPLSNCSILLQFIINVIVVTLGGFLLSMLAIKYTSVSITSILSAMEPVFVLLFAFIINHERATQREIIGSAIAILGLLIIITH